MVSTSDTSVVDEAGARGQTWALGREGSGKTLPGTQVSWSTGCYPKCPPTAPIFDEGTMQCVSNCTVTPSPLPPPPCRINGKLYRPGASVPSDKNCYSW